jgi:hypothetical protein
MIIYDRDLTEDGKIFLEPVVGEVGEKIFN